MTGRSPQSNAQQTEHPGSPRGSAQPKPGPRPRTGSRLPDPHRAAGAARKPFRYQVAGMDCASCAKTIEQGLEALPGIEDVRVNFTTETIEGTGDVAPETLRERVAALGYELVDDAVPIDTPAVPRGGLAGFGRFLRGQRQLELAVLGAAAVLATFAIEHTLGGRVIAAAADPIRWLVIALVGYPIARRGLTSLFLARRITIDLLMTVATLGAVAIGASGEAAAVVLLFTLGEALEGYSAARSRASLRSLLALRPARATLIREHGSSTDRGESFHRHYDSVAVEALAPGDRVLVKPGERIPADGHVAAGSSSVDNSAITGEPAPVPRETGDPVFAGTINGRGTLEVEVACRAEDFTIAEIARLVERAQAQRSPAERFIDRFARWYTPLVVLLAAAVAIVPPLALGAPFAAAEDGAHGWLYRGLALLIVACPCALIISIPVTVVSALTRLAHLGVLVKGGAQLDALGAAQVFAFDKTGTLTGGRPTVAGIRALACEHGETHIGKANAGGEAKLDETNPGNANRWRANFDEVRLGEATLREACAPCDDIVALAASVERGSEHPFAQAVLDAAEARRVEHRYAAASNVQSHAGRGVTGTLDGRRVTVGNVAMFDRSTAALRIVDEHADASSSLVLVGDERDVLGYIRLEDRLRESSRAALRTLKEIDPDYRFVMLTGDRAAVASSIAARLGGIDEVRAELLPEQKLAAVRALESEAGIVVMVGDGINDTPALAAAQLGVAMGGAGSPQAMEVADVVLMQDDLSRLPMAVRMSRKTRRLIRENIALSLGLKLAFLVLAVPGIATLWMAVVADVGATVLVTLNGMRMLRTQVTEKAYQDS